MENTRYMERGRPDNGKKKDKFVRTNWKIRARTTRLVAEGSAPSVMSTREALDRAQGAGLDLVELAYDPRTDTSTCRICDYGKYVYDMKQREKQARKQARASQADLKCLQIRLTTDTADMDRVVRKAKEFLQDGDRVRLSLRFRGRREMANVGMAKDVMKALVSNFDGMAVMDVPPDMSNREMYCILRSVCKGKG